MVIRVLLALLFPPLAVLDKSCGTILVVFICTLLGWIPGVIVAIVYCINDQKNIESQNK